MYFSFTLLNLTRNKGFDIPCYQDKHTRNMKISSKLKRQNSKHMHMNHQIKASNFPFYISRIFWAHIGFAILTTTSSHWIAVEYCALISSPLSPWKMEKFLVLSSITCDVAADVFTCFWYIVYFVLLLLVLRRITSRTCILCTKRENVVQWREQHFLRSFLRLLSSRFTSYRLFLHFHFHCRGKKNLFASNCEDDVIQAGEYGDDRHQIIINNDSNISLNVMIITISGSFVWGMKMDSLLQFSNFSVGERKTWD